MQFYNTNNSQEFSLEMVMKIIDIIVKKFIKNTVLSYEDYDDTSQMLIEKFLIKQDDILRNFNNKAKIQTYISAVIYRMCLEIIREKNNLKNRQIENEVYLNKDYQQREINQEERMIIEYEKKYLIKVLESFGNEHSKLLVFLKLFYRIRLTDSDIDNYCDTSASKRAILSEIKTADDLKNDKDVYLIMCKINSLAGNKDVMPDAMRMYINQITDKVIIRLNGKHGRANYTRDSLGILMEITFC